MKSLDLLMSLDKAQAIIEDLIRSDDLEEHFPEHSSDDIREVLESLSEYIGGVKDTLFPDAL